MVNFLDSENIYKIFDYARYPQAIREYQDAENEFLITHTKADSEILDVGCGIGRHIKLLANHSKRVVGIERHPLIYKRAITELSEIQNIAVHLQEAEDMKYNAEFDYVICMFNTFGNIKSNTQKMIITKMKNSLRKGGEIFISVYAEHATPYMKTLYNNYNLQTIGEDADYIYTSDGFASEKFTQEKLRRIFQQDDLEIITLTPISYMCRIPIK